jgi:hypothetical protein
VNPEYIKIGLLAAILAAIIWDGLLTRRWLAHSRRALEEIDKQSAQIQGAMKKSDDPRGI